MFFSLSRDFGIPQTTFWQRPPGTCGRLLPVYRQNHIRAPSLFPGHGHDRLKSIQILSQQRKSAAT